MVTTKFKWLTLLHRSLNLIVDEHESTRGQGTVSVISPLCTDGLGLSPLLSWFPNKENWRQARPVLGGAACNLATCSTHSTLGNCEDTVSMTEGHEL